MPYVEHVVVAIDGAGERLQAVCVRHTNSGNAEDRNADGGDDKADDGRNHIAARHLTEVDGENKVAGAKEHTEQGRCHQNALSARQFFCCHFVCAPSIYELIVNAGLVKWKRVIIIVP